MKKLLVPALTLAAGFVGGWFIPKPLVAPPAASAAVAAPPAALVPVPAANATATPDKSPEAKATAAAADLSQCRAVLKAEKNPARATVKLLAMLDGMDAASVSALAAELTRTASANWYDAQSATLTSLVFGKLAELDAPAALRTAMQTKDLWGRLSASSAVLEQMARTSPAAAVAAAEKFPPGYLRRNLIANLASSVAQRDGPAALDILQRMKVPPNDWAWGQMVGVWANHDPAGAAAQLLTLPRQTALNSVDSLAAAWAKRDPAAAMTWAQALTDPALRRSALSNTISTIAQSDPQQATALANAQPAVDRRELLGGIARSMAQTDGPGAIAWAQAIADPQERQRCLWAVAQGAGFADSTTAREAVNLLPPGALRNRALDDLAGSLAWSDPLAARDWALTLKPAEQALVMRDIVGRLAGADLEAAEKLADSLPPAGDNQWAWRSIAGQKALKDPAAALTWAGALETEQARLSATGAVFSQWAGHSPDKAAAALAGITDANVRRSATEQLAQAWANRSPAEATQWAESLTGEDRITALAAVWNASATDDPRAAGTSLAAAAASAGSATATDKLAASAATIAAAWAGQSPTDAAAWATNLPDGKIREDALGQVAGEWAAYDPAGVSEWINGLPHDRSRDAAIGQLVNRIVKTDPESAFTWAASVGNAEKQAETLKAAATAWKAINPEAARAAVQNAALPEDARARLMEAIR